MDKHQDEHVQPDVRDMTLRDYFAGKAITGWLASRESDLLLAKCGDDVGEAMQQMAIAAYSLAEAMMEVRETEL